MQRATLIRAGVPLLGIAATIAAAADSSETVAATAGIAVLANLAVMWSASFAAHHARKPERAWTMWMLYPSFAAFGAAVLARYVWPIWSVAALVVVAMPTIMIHALFMGQRDKKGKTAPEGHLAAIVAWLPVVFMYALLIVLIVTGVVEFVR